MEGEKWKKRKKGLRWKRKILIAGKEEEDGNHRQGWMTEFIVAGERKRKKGLLSTFITKSGLWQFIITHLPVSTLSNILNN